jgi:hypothetical protein
MFLCLAYKEVKFYLSISPWTWTAKSQNKRETAERRHFTKRMMTLIIIIAVIIMGYYYYYQLHTKVYRISFSQDQHFRCQAHPVCITADTTKQLSGNGTTDIGYWEHFHVTSKYCSIMSCTCQATCKLSETSPDVSFSYSWRDFTKQNQVSWATIVKFSFILTISSTETFICKTINDASVQGIYKLPHSWVTITTTVTTNSPKCVLKGILVQISGVEALPRSVRSTKAGQQ